MSGTWPAKLIAASVLLIAPLYASVDEAAGQDLKDEVQRVIAPAPAGGGKPVSREYEDYLPDVVFFESAPPPPPSLFKKKMLEKKGIALEDRPAQRLLGRLYTPSRDDPLPAVVLLHGADGIWDWNDLWAERLMHWGYVVLDVDSMTPRGLYPHNTGLGETATGGKRRHIGAFVRSLDAIGAARFLAGLPYVDAERIAAMGMSQGGTTVLYALADQGGQVSRVFRAGVALYPECDSIPRFTAPLLVLLGDSDMWVHVGLCRENLAAAGRNSDVVFQLYHGVHHVFDLAIPERRVAGRLLRYDQVAAEDAETRIRDFLQRQLSGEP